MPYVIIRINLLLWDRDQRAYSYCIEVRTDFKHLKLVECVECWVCGVCGGCEMLTVCPMCKMLSVGLSGEHGPVRLGEGCGPQQVPLQELADSLLSPGTKHSTHKL